MKEKILISSCLCGNNTKYNGGNNIINNLDKIKEKYELYLICPEVMGGLTIPRVPSEIINNTVINKEGQDVTSNYNLGANIALEIALKNGIKKAILKEGSPSCGVNQIYDGTFRGKKIDGSGITTRLLQKHNIKVYNENQIDELIKEEN